MKRYLSVLLAVAMVFTLFAGLTVSAADEDLSDYTIDQIVLSNVSNGLALFEGDGTSAIDWDATISRAQAFGLLAKVSLGVTASKLLTATENKFIDWTADTEWAKEEVAYLVGIGAVDGSEEYEGWMIFPEDDISVIGYTKLILGALGYGKYGEFTGSAWETNVYTAASYLGLLDGIDTSELASAIDYTQASIITWNAMFLQKVTSYVYLGSSANANYEKSTLASVNGLAEGWSDIMNDGTASFSYTNNGRAITGTEIAAAPLKTSNARYTVTEGVQDGRNYINVPGGYSYYLNAVWTQASYEATASTWKATDKDGNEYTVSGNTGSKQTNLVSLTSGQIVRKVVDNQKGTTTYFVWDQWLVTAGATANNVQGVQYAYGTYDDADNGLGTTAPITTLTKTTFQLRGTYAEGTSLVVLADSWNNCLEEMEVSPTALSGASYANPLTPAGNIYEEGSWVNITKYAADGGINFAGAVFLPKTISALNNAASLFIGFGNVGLAPYSPATRTTLHLLRSGNNTSTTWVLNAATYAYDWATNGTWYDFTAANKTEVATVHTKTNQFTINASNESAVYVLTSAGGLRNLGLPSVTSDTYYNTVTITADIRLEDEDDDVFYWDKTQRTLVHQGHVSALTLGTYRGEKVPGYYLSMFGVTPTTYDAYVLINPIYEIDVDAYFTWLYRVGSGYYKTIAQATAALKRLHLNLDANGVVYADSGYYFPYEGEIVKIGVSTAVGQEGELTLDYTPTPTSVPFTLPPELENATDFTTYAAYLAPLEVPTEALVFLLTNGIGGSKLDTPAEITGYTQVAAIGDLEPSYYFIYTAGVAPYIYTYVILIPAT